MRENGHFHTLWEYRLVQGFRRTIWESLLPQCKMQIPASFLCIYALMSRISFLRACPNFLQVQGFLSQKEKVAMSPAHSFQQKEI